MLKKIILATMAGFAYPAHALELSGTICGPDEQPISGLTVTLSAPDSQSFSTNTDENGRYAITVPEEAVTEGVLTVDAIEVISSGYSRPKELPWNTSLPNELPLIELEEITPELTFERRADGTNCLRFTFDWVAGAVPETLRSYCVERSHNLITWTTVMNVGMACPPVEFIDETVPLARKCYYRIRPLESIWMPNVLVDDIFFIGDPTMVPFELQEFAPFWPDNTVLISDDRILDPSVPIIAPEIRLTP